MSRAAVKPSSSVAEGREAIDLDCLRSLAALGLPDRPRSRLVVGAEGARLAQLVDEVIGASPGQIVTVDRRGARDPDFGQEHNLIVTCGVLGGGTVSDAARWVAGMAAALSPSGRLAAAIETFATATSDGRADVVLFPDLGALGLLGADIEDRTPLTPAAWLALLSSARLSVRAMAGYGEEPLGAEVLERHAARLAPFDPREIATGRLLVVADKPGAPA